MPYSSAQNLRSAHKTRTAEVRRERSTGSSSGIPVITFSIVCGRFSMARIIPRCHTAHLRPARRQIENRIRRTAAKTLASRSCRSRHRGIRRDGILPATHWMGSQPRIWGNGRFPLRALLGGCARSGSRSWRFLSPPSSVFGFQGTLFKRGRRCQQLERRKKWRQLSP